jgi:hypothetical protein
MVNESKISEAIDSLVDELSYHRPEETHSVNRSEFNGYTIADSLGFIADALSKIAEVYENQHNRNIK